MAARGWMREGLKNRPSAGRGGPVSILYLLFGLSAHLTPCESADYSSPRQTILPFRTITVSSAVPSSKITVGLYCTMSICTVERAGWP